MAHISLALVNQSKVNNIIFYCIFGRFLVSIVKLARQLMATSTCWKLIRPVKRSQQGNKLPGLEKDLLRGRGDTIIVNTSCEKLIS